MKTKTCKNLALAGGIAVAFGGLVQSSYGTLSFESDTTTVGGNAVSASADITISGNIMTVTLTDTLVNPSGVANVLNGIQINISGVTGVSGLSANDATIASVATAGTGSYTPTTASGTTIASAYDLSYGSSIITLTALGGGEPKYLILGPDANDNFTYNAVNDPGYSGANSSIAGNGPHNPFILGQETFTFNLSGSLLSEDNISGITFLFGTGSDYSGSTPTPVPEPSTVVAGALLLLPLGVSVARIMRKQRAVPQKI